ncbi:protein folded gastrulation [Drosophila miranda]|uniref:protein folded gastrulation n=1 Tax=Drosophila miranda TaxID=7229 RepID=UPI0007E75C56|nr:protein folded gastrulation [Drosophila miranda]XP_017153079.1 protein folded gastrulation [Drosophila miranda]XP_017153087.1 protein folded gastrulation [Drosophila miranda]XP_033242153.1 protein folded gastrulation [Drosophila miranda]XP_033242159.1 protein folded gastrulation [Drosophila miranda]
MASSRTGTGSGTRTRTRTSAGSSRWLMNFLLAVAALNLHLEGGAHALPITSRPIEGNAQRMAWDEWLSLPLEQKSLEKEKKVTAKSIFTLPFRHCPPGHTLYNEHCIPQINIDPADLLKQELIYANAGAPGSGSPTAIITDYDYSEDGSEEVSGDELLYDLEPQSQQTMGEAGGEDQALPSADAPLKFNIFEKKFPTGPALGGESSPEESPEEETARLPPIVAATATSDTATATTTPKPATTPTATPNPKATPSNRIPAGGDLQAASSNALSTTSSNIDIGNIAAIVVPAGGQMAPPDASSSSVLLVTSSLTTADSNADANESGKTNAGANPSRKGVGDFKVNGNAEAEADLAQLLKVDAFLPAYEGSSIELLPPPPPFNHRRVAPPLSADQEDPEVEQETEMETEMEEETTTDIVDVEDEATTDTTETTSSSTSTSTVVEAETTMEESSSSSSSSSPSPAQHPQTHQKEEPEIDEGGNRLLLIKSKVQPVQVTATSSTTSTQSTTTTIEAETQETAAAEDDRFHYQQIPKDVAGTTTTEIPAAGSSSSSSIRSHFVSGEYPLLDEEAEEESDNLMTNTIGGEINVDEELRKINELVKGTRRLLQQQQTSSSSSSSSTEASSTSYATESSTNWSKLMPQATATTTTETTAKTAATESTTSTTAAATPAATATATATSTTAATSHLSINTNRSNRNSKIIRVAQAEDETTTVATSTAAAAATTPNTSSSSSSKDDDEYTPFWWLPNIGWRLDRQVDRNGEDRALLLRFFSTFRASDGAMASTLPPRR